MKKIPVFLSGIFLIISFFQCSGTQKPDPGVTECKTVCRTTMERCVKKASENAAKKAACEAVESKCSLDCEKK